MTKPAANAKSVIFNGTTFDSQRALARHLSGGNQTLENTIQKKISRLTNAGVTRLVTADFPNAVLPQVAQTKPHDGKTVTFNGQEFKSAYYLAKHLANGNTVELNRIASKFTKMNKRGKFDFTDQDVTRVGTGGFTAKQVVYNGQVYTSINKLAQDLAPKASCTPIAMWQRIMKLVNMNQSITDDIINYQDQRMKPVQINHKRFESITAAAKAMNDGQTDYYDMINSMTYIRKSIEAGKQIKLI